MNKVIPRSHHWFMNRGFHAGMFAFLLLLAYLPVLVGPSEFIGDDDYFISENSRVTSFGVKTLAEIWSKPMRVEYFPVTITSFAIDYALWGPNPKLFRLMNIVLLYLIGLVAWSLGRQLNRDMMSKGGSPAEQILSISVILAALHPANVESVASVANRKELLMVLFGLLSIHAFVRADEKHRFPLASLTFMALSQLSKGTSVVIPFLLSAYMFLMHRNKKGTIGSFLVLLPFFALASALFSYQFHVALGGNVVAQDTPFTATARIGGIIRTLNTAITAFLMPRNNSYDYDLTWPSGLPPAVEWITPGLLGIALVFLTIRKRLVSLFILMLVLLPFLPYLNIVPLRGMLPTQLVFYDHYLLFPAMASSALVTRAALAYGTRHRILIVTAICGLIALFTVQDFRLARFWKTKETLYTRVVQISPNLPRAYFYLGKSYYESGNYDKAIQWIRAGLNLNRGYPDTDIYQMLGDAYAFSGNIESAIEAYKNHLILVPDNRKSLQNLSAALITAHRDTEAMEVLMRLLLLYPDDRIGEENLRILRRRWPSSGK